MFYKIIKLHRYIINNFFFGVTNFLKQELWCTNAAKSKKLLEKSIYFVFKRLRYVRGEDKFTSPHHESVKHFKKVQISIYKPMLAVEAVDLEICILYSLLKPIPINWPNPLVLESIVKITLAFIRVKWYSVIYAMRRHSHQRPCLNLAKGS